MGRKQLYRYFEQQTGEISHVKTWIWQQKGNLKRGTESLLIAAQNYTIKVNYIRAKINNTQQNSRCRLCGDKNETINHIVSRCNEFAQKEYKSRHNWVGKVIHWELCKGLKFGHTTKWYMHKVEPFLQN